MPGIPVLHNLLDVPDRAFSTGRIDAYFRGSESISCLGKYVEVIKHDFYKDIILVYNKMSSVIPFTFNTIDF